MSPTPDSPEPLRSAPEPLRSAPERSDTTPELLRSAPTPLRSAPEHINIITPTLQTPLIHVFFSSILNFPIPWKGI